MDSPPPAAILLIEKEMQRRTLEKQKHWHALHHSGLWMVATFFSMPVLGVPLYYLHWWELATYVFMGQFSFLIWQALSFIFAAVMLIICSRRG